MEQVGLANGLPRIFHGKKGVYCLHGTSVALEHVHLIVDIDVRPPFHFERIGRQ